MKTALKEIWQCRRRYGWGEDTLMFKKYVEYYTQFRVPYFKQILETHDHELMTMDLQTVH